MPNRDVTEPAITSTPIRVLVVSPRPAPLTMFLAVVAPTRLNSSCRKPDSERAPVSLSIWISRPSSTPWGCGLISVVSGGSSLVLRS